MKLQLTVYRAQRRRIQRLYKKTQDRIVALRCRIVLLLHQRHGAATVSKLCDCVRATVYRTYYRFVDDGEDGLLDQRHHRPPTKVTDELVARLVSYPETSPLQLGWQRSSWTAELLQLQLLKDTQVQLSLSCIRALLHQHDYRRRRPRQGLRIPVRGRRQVIQRIKALVASASPQAEVFYVDEADIDLNPRLGATWMPRGKQRVVLTPGQNQKRYIAGALNARTGTLTHLYAKRKNSALFMALVDALCRRYRRSKVLHLILDNFIIHKSKQVQRYLASLGPRVVLHFLPPYSPEHNRIERLWKQLHDHVTRNHQYKSLESLLWAVELFLLCAQPFPGTKVSTTPRLFPDVSGSVRVI